MHLKNMDEIFAEDMADPEYVAGYLEAVLEEGDPEAFFLALRNVAKAKSGGREVLPRTLLEQNDPEFKTVQSLLSALGLRFSITRVETPLGVSA